MAKKKLYIYTFGNLLVRKEEQVLFSGENKNLNKRWHLFLLLLFNKGKKLTDQDLIRKLALDENVEPRQSLRALVYRLRKDVKLDGTDFILSEQGGYSFNTESRYWLDIDYFFNIIEKAKEKEDDQERALRLYQRALDLYEGAFLNNQYITDNYLVKLRSYYRELYLKAVASTGDILINLNRFQEAIEMYEMALKTHPKSIGLYLDMIDAFKKNNRPDLALIKTEEAMTFLKNSNLPMPPELQQQISDFFETDIDEDPAYYFEKNKLCQGDVFQCGPMTFSSIFALEKRRARRNKYDISLIHFQLNGRATPVDVNKSEVILRDVLMENLRESDVITRWKPRHYLMLAVDQSEEEIENLLARIEELYDEEFPPSDINLSYSYQQL
ncbi:MAG: BTAD domain-containing putative transcriptional regulator [Halarsenatibacteraceae bacterium]